MGEGLKRAVAATRRTRMDPAQLAAYLRAFVREAIVSEVQKRALRNAGFIVYEHGGWNLSAAGKAEATRMGFL